LVAKAKPLTIDPEKAAKSAEFVYAVILETAISEKIGQAFEDFFASIGNALWGGDFEPWKPQGPIGDLKCDGYLASAKTVFQCYAPEQMTAAKTIAKIEADFLGAIGHFGPAMKKWVFVHNQKNGLHATAGMKIAELREANSKFEITVWNPIEIKRQLKILSLRSMADLLTGTEHEFDFDADTLETLAQLVRLKESLPISSEEKIEASGHQNIDELNDKLEELGANDREVRRRLLGYSRWYDPAEKTMVFEDLKERGYDQNLVETNAQQLEAEELILVSDNYFLPNNMEICQQAADTLLDEFIHVLGAQ